MTDAREQARQLLMMAALKARVKEVDDDLRAQAKDDLDVGSTVAYTLPEDEGQKRPRVVGTAALRRGNTVARVADRPAFVAWVKANAPTEHYETPGGVEETVLNQPMRESLADAIEAANVAASAGDWADPVADMVRTLAGYGLVIKAAEDRPARNEVRPAYEDLVMKASVTAGLPCAPGGEAPDGVTVTEGDPTIAVTLSKDSSIVGAFVEGIDPADLAAVIRIKELESS